MAEGLAQGGRGLGRVSKALGPGGRLGPAGRLGLESGVRCPKPGLITHTTCFRT